MKKYANSYVTLLCRNFQLLLFFCINIQGGHNSMLVQKPWIYGPRGVTVNAARNVYYVKLTIINQEIKNILIFRNI